jgi:hypothetical protein
MELTKEQKMVMLTFFYMGKLSEFGLSEGGEHGITAKGFDIAYDLYKSGLKISKKEMGMCLRSIMKDTPDEVQEQFLALMLHMQEVGFDTMKEELIMMQNET